MAQNAVVLSTMTMSSFAGLAVTLVPWLLAGGTLTLHHPFDPATFDAQHRNSRADTVVLPGPIVPHLMEAGRLSMRDGLKNVIGIWRAPERLARAPAWREARTGMIDVQVFGETGLIAARRGASGRPAAIPFGLVAAPRGSKSAVVVAEVVPTATGTVALRGPMVPRCAFPPGAERTDLPHFKTGPTGHVDTGYACRVDGVEIMLLTGPPPGIGGVGGYRFLLRELQDVVSSVGGGGTLAALPDALSGHRLAGDAPDRDQIRQALTELGVNPLLVGAFRERRRPAA